MDFYLFFSSSTLMFAISRRHSQISFEAAQSEFPDVGVKNLQILAFLKIFNIFSTSMY